MTVIPGSTAVKAFPARPAASNHPPKRLHQIPLPRSQTLQNLLNPEGKDICEEFFLTLFIYAKYSSFMSSPTPVIPDMPVPNLHRQVPQYLARRFWQIAATFQSEALAPFGLVPWQVALLAQISVTPGKDRNWLAAAIGIDATSTGQALTLFEARGLVLREANQADRRANAFSLTPAGAALRAELVGPVREVAQRLVSPLSKTEAATLLTLLAKVVDAHQVFARPGAGRRLPRRARKKGDATC